MNQTEDFVGVKVALRFGDDLLVIQRDDKPSIRWPGRWDFPGGGRENSETPFECAAREVNEELGIIIDPGSVIWQRRVPSMDFPDRNAYFMVVTISNADVKDVVFGNEGQDWKMMSIQDFLKASNVVTPLKDRLNSYLRNS